MVWTSFICSCSCSGDPVSPTMGTTHDSSIGDSPGANYRRKNCYSASSQNSKQFHWQNITSAQNPDLTPSTKMSRNMDDSMYSFSCDKPVEPVAENDERSENIHTCVTSECAADKESSKRHERYREFFEKSGDFNESENGELMSALRRLRIDSQKCNNFHQNTNFLSESKTLWMAYKQHANTSKKNYKRGLANTVIGSGDILRRSQSPRMISQILKAHDGAIWSTTEVGLEEIKSSDSE